LSPELGKQDPQIGQSADTCRISLAMLVPLFCASANSAVVNQHFADRHHFEGRICGHAVRLAHARDLAPDRQKEVGG